MSDWTSPTPTASANMTLIERVKQLLHDTCGSPSVSMVKASGGALAAGPLNVRVSALTEFGETVPCTRVSLTVLLNDKVTLTITRVPQARGYRVYASQGTAAETYQADVAPGQGATVTLVISSVAAGSAMPTVDTATVHLPAAAYNQAVTAGLLEYSGNNPKIDQDTVAQTTGTYEYDLPVDWDYGLSSIQQIEYPSGEDPKSFLDLRLVYLTGDGHWRWNGYSPQTGKSAIIHYTRPYLESEIPPAHFDAVGLLCAATAAETLGAKYAHQSNAVIGADTVDYKLRAADFDKQARIYREAAWRTLGSPGGVKGHSARATWGWKEERQAVPEENYKVGGQLFRS